MDEARGQVAGRGGDEVGRGRLEALSDGVFAIVVTLLVLELKVPHLEAGGSTAELATALRALAPKFTSWVISFVTVCVIWLNHHRLLRLVRRIDGPFFWWNANLLLWTSFIPFPTALMGDHPGNPLAVSFYGLVMGLMALAFVLLRWRLLRREELLEPVVDREAFRRGTAFSIVLGPAAYLASAGLAWISSPLALTCYAAIAASFVVPRAAQVGR